MRPPERFLDDVGGAARTGRTRAAQLDRALAALRHAHGSIGGRASAFFVPGRIEVLGKHTDYAGGRSLVCAVEHGFVLAAAPRPDHTVRVVNAETGNAVSCEIDPMLVPPAGQWATYPLTVVRRLARNFPAFGRGATLAFSSDLPQAAGLSSSSALIIAVFLGLAEANDLEAAPAFTDAIHSREDLAAYLATIENGHSFRQLAGDAGVGTFGGSEDHTAILCCRDGHLAQYSFAPVRLERHVALDDTLTFVVVDSGVEARKTGDARDRYNRASRLASRVLDMWRQVSGEDPPTLAAAAEAGAAERRRMRDVLRASDDAEFPAEDLLDRFEQWCVESLEIVPAAGDALARGDLERFGSIVSRSQRMAETWLRNQVPETVALASLAREHGAVAASAFGAGFGGSVWALVRRDEERRFTGEWMTAYRARFPERADRVRALSTRPGPAAYRLASNLALSDR